jgi:hypothetical protein
MAAELHCTQLYNKGIKTISSGTNLWCADKCLTTGWWGGANLWLIVFASFHDVNTPTIADFKTPVCKMGDE